MDTGWIIFILCFIVVLGGALPLIRRDDRHTPPPPKNETLRDWRNEP